LYLDKMRMHRQFMFCIAGLTWNFIKGILCRTSLISIYAYLIIEVNAVICLRKGGTWSRTKKMRFCYHFEADDERSITEFESSHYLNWLWSYC
jgi:hypothetical protein